MRKMIALTATFSFVALAFVGVIPARAESTMTGDMATCQQRLEEVQQDWKASPLPKSNGREQGMFKRDHDHPAMAENFMRGQLNQATKLCKEGKDHEALLHIDVVRSWLKLPFEAHPESHGYMPSQK